jgi:ribose transport system permease protein
MEAADSKAPVTATSEQSTNTYGKMNWVLNLFINNRAISLLLLIVAMSALMSAFFPTTFFSFYNLSAILLSLSLEGILAVGMMFLLVSGVFDLSVGSSIAVGGAVCAYMMKVVGLPIPISMLIGIMASVGAGFANGIMVAKVGVNALIATLAMMGILRGIAILIAGAGIIGLPEVYSALGQAMFLGFQMPVYYMVFLVIIGAIVLAKTRFFRQMYFIGGNQKAASLSGINVDRCLIINFIVMGLLCGISGVVLTARLSSAIGTIGAGVEMRVITAVVIGGGSLAGGRGTVLGAFMGALFMGLLNNMMVIGGVNVYYQSIVIGLVLLAAVSIDVYLLKRYGGVH